MIVTARDARKIIAQHYGNDFEYRILSRSTTLGVRPVLQTTLGYPTLAWIRLSPGQDSAVRIGKLLPDNTIDWMWDNNAT